MKRFLALPLILVPLVIACGKSGDVSGPSSVTSNQSPNAALHDTICHTTGAGVILIAPSQSGVTQNPSNNGQGGHLGNEGNPNQPQFPDQVVATGTRPGGPLGPSDPRLGGPPGVNTACPPPSR